jgi:hypothetical protein
MITCKSCQQFFDVSIKIFLRWQKWAGSSRDTGTREPQEARASTRVKHGINRGGNHDIKRTPEVPHPSGNASQPRVENKGFAVKKRIVEALENYVVGKIRMPYCVLRHMPQVNRKTACMQLNLSSFSKCSRGERRCHSLRLDVSTGSSLNVSLSRYVKRGATVIGNRIKATMVGCERYPHLSEEGRANRESRTVGYATV